MKTIDRLVNLTPHRVDLRLPSGIIISWQPSGTIARVATRATPMPDGYLHTAGDAETPVGFDLPVAQVSHGDAIGLPAPEEGVVYIVSILVLQAVAGIRGDCVAPGTGPQDGAIRNIEGQVEAVTRFVVM